MSESTGSPVGQWRYGLHPQARGMQVRSLGRVDLALGEALRLELAEPGSSVGGTVHVQYYIATDAGPWALWLSCPPEDVEAEEKALWEVAAPLTGEPQDRPPALDGPPSAPPPGGEAARG